MKLKYTKTIDNALKEIEKQIENNWIRYINEEDKELNQKNIVIKVTKKKVLRAVTLSLDKPMFRLYVNKKDFGLFFKKSGVWVSEMGGVI